MTADRTESIDACDRAALGILPMDNPTFEDRVMAYRNRLQQAGIAPELVQQMATDLAQVHRVELEQHTTLKTTTFTAVVGLLSALLGAFVSHRWTSASADPPGPSAAAASASLKSRQPAEDCRSMCEQIVKVASPSIEGIGEGNRGTISVSYGDVTANVSSELLACTNSCEQLKSAAAHSRPSDGAP